MKLIIKNHIKNQLKEVTAKKTDSQEIEVTPTSSLKLGDYTTNIAFKIAKKLKKTPKEIADQLITQLPQRYFKKIENVNGFINFWLDQETIYQKILLLINNHFQPVAFTYGPFKKIVIEYAQPNTHKLFHIGHLRNITLGESLARIFEFLGNEVYRTNYQGDVGLHIAKALYAILLNKKEYEKIKKTDNLDKKIAFIGKMYTLGNQHYEKNPSAKKKITKINQMIYEKNPQIYPLWQETRQWSLDYFDLIYKKLDTRFNKLYFESQTYQEAKKYIDEGIKKKFLVKSQGAIVFLGEKFGLDTRVFLNSLGYPTYEGKELPLAYWEFNDFGKIDKCIHLTTPEQKSFFAVTFKVEELLFPETIGKQYHLAYEWVNLKTGKMSSREGNIIEANWLINQIKNKLLKKYKISEAYSLLLSIASIKYSFLKNSPLTKINFDIDESISLHGNSASYLMYTFVRSQSILKKTNKIKAKITNINFEKLSLEEKNLTRFLFFFEDAVNQAASSLSTQFLTNYLYQLGQKFNLFYEKFPVLKADESLKNFRLTLTLATANTLKKGLEILGIKTIDKM